MLKKEDAGKAHSAYLIREVDEIYAELESLIDGMLISCGPGVEIAVENMVASISERLVESGSLYTYSEKTARPLMKKVMDRVKGMYTDAGWKLSVYQEKMSDGKSTPMLVKFE